MIYQRSHLFLLFCVLFLSFTTWSLPDHSSGVVVEKVGPNAEAEKAGIKAGDVLVTWSRQEENGSFQSPFDLPLIEIEQAPRGPVTLEGITGTAKQAWTLGPAKWGLDVRPELPEDLLSLYRAGEKSAAEGKAAEAAVKWTTAANQIGKSQPQIASWFWSRAARLFADGHQWKESDAAYEASIQNAGGLGQAIEVQLLRSWAITYERRADWRNAEKYHRLAVKQSLAAGPDTLLTAWCLLALGNMFRVHGDLTNAEEYLGQSLAISQRLAPGSWPVAASLNSLGVTVQDRGQLDKAEQYLTQALEIRQKQAPDGLDVAATLNNLGSVKQDQGDLAQAEEQLLRALAIKEKLAPDSLDAAYTYSALGNVIFERGDLPKAEEYIRHSLEIRNKLAPDDPEIAVNLGNLGSVKWEEGDLTAADEYYRKALEIEQKFAPENLDAANTLDNLGNVALSRRDLVKAGEYHHQALRIRQKLAPVSLDMGRGFDNLGNLAEEEGGLVMAARYYRQALTIQEKLAPNSLIVAVSLSNLGGVAEKRGDWNAAERYYARALDIEQKLAPDSLDTAATLGRSADMARNRGNLLLAEKLYRQALAIQERLASGSAQYAESLAALASLMRRKGQFNEAAKLFDQSLNALETQIRHLGGTEDIRTDFRAIYAHYYSEYIDLLVRQQRPELAFHISERLRARALLETLAAARVDIHNGADPALLERERLLQLLVRAKTDRRVLLLTRKHTTEQVEAVEREIGSLRAEYEQIESKIRATSPAYAALTQPQPLTVQDVQHVLDGDTLLLEYSLGDERSYLWAMTSTTVTVHEIPNRATIEAAARRLYKLTSEFKHPGTAGARISDQRKALLSTAVAAMSRMVLAPVTGQLGKPRLWIVADGALQYTPFALLAQPGKRIKDPLFLEHEIVYSPSASVLAELRREAAARAPAPKAVAVLADPVFDREDPRVNIKPKNPNQGTNKRWTARMLFASQLLSRSAADAGLAGLSRLAFSRREADAIMKFTPAGQGLEAIDFEASRSTATSHALAQYRVVHFATHALSDNRHPEFSGLVLSMVDQRGRPQNGFLDLQDIYNLNLPAELVVLSACETALGKEVQGEGLLGLTHGFMYAGATRVIASLWSADDVSTKELMEKFYRAMEQEGLRPAAALRSAQLAMWKQQRWKDPYYWAAFKTQGEWN